MGFHKLEEKQSGLIITHKKDFTAPGTFKPETIKKVFDFAFDMTFGEKGEHRKYRTGGTIKRKNGEVFANTFQGKLAECAACNLFYKIDSSVFPDFSIAKLGTWDSVDVVVNKKKIAVKSTKSFGNLLLLEQHDWDSNGIYIPNREDRAGTYDYFLLIRIKPFCEDIMRKQRWLYLDAINRAALWSEVGKYTWSYDYAGYIALDDFQCIIRENFVIQKGTLLNGATRIDADNYYVQAGDMRDVADLLKELSSEEGAVTSVGDKDEQHVKIQKPRKRWYDFIFKRRR